MLVALFSKGDPFHEQAGRALRNLQAGRHGKVFTTDFVLAETLNFFVARSRDPAFPDRVARELLGEDGAPWLKLVAMDERTWKLAREKFRSLSKAGLSFTDCTSLAAVERLGLDGILSYDRGFDGHTTRLVE